MPAGERVEHRRQDGAGVAARLPHVDQADVVRPVFQRLLDEQQVAAGNGGGHWLATVEAFEEEGNDTVEILGVTAIEQRRMPERSEGIYHAGSYPTTGGFKPG